MSDPVAARAARDAAAVFDLTGWTVIGLIGRDATKFLNSFCTNDLKKLPAGGGCEAFVTNVKARAVGHVFAFQHSDVMSVVPEVWLIGSPGQGERLAAHLDRYIITEDVTVRDDSQNVGLLYVVGPEAAERLSSAICEAPNAVRGTTPLTTEFPRIDGLHCPVRRIELLGAPGYLVELLQENVAAIRERLEAAGVVPGDAATFDALRIAACFPLYGIDVTEEHLAPEVGRPWAISYTKGCYLGQEPIARIDALGHVNRLLRGLRIESDAAPAVGAAVTADGKAIGAVTSAALSPEDGRAMALAYLRTKFAEPGTVVSVETSAGPAAAAVYGPAGA